MARHVVEKFARERERPMRMMPGTACDRPHDEPGSAWSVRELDDAAIVARSVREPDQFAVIYDRYFGEVYRYLAARLGRGLADDLAAETFLVAFHKRDRFDPALGRVRPWLYGIATILVGQYRRKETRRYRALIRAGRSVLDSVESHADRVNDAVTAERLGQDLAAALAALGQGDRDVLLLVAIGELSHQEVALALGIPYGTVGSRLNRARGELRAALDVRDTTFDPEEPING